ncbi:anti-anti-sigma factor [Amycolatopsis xylanica]|uniref:Anti-anti-sigma factor n=1 Tax=Amycolatopsis xylanica TaxID=589385 RepID=A0A1H2UGU0_9PSEU|nr:STAS domain-containing protein [Amycolatopsis xylanica]SDW55373.1 anti-anti-sigma factor [Amycolatopsis xylanica]
MTSKRPPRLSRTFGRTVIGSLSEQFSVTVTTFGAGRAVITIAGDLDLANVDKVAELTAGMPRPESLALLVDLTEVRFCSSVGLNMLCELQRRANEAEVEMALVVSGFPMRRTLRMTGMDRAFVIYRERAEALLRLGISFPLDQ